MAVYLDTSALVKLVADEAESRDLAAFVGDDEIISSLITRVELVRAVARKHERLIEQAEDLLAGMDAGRPRRVSPNLISGRRRSGIG